MPSMPHGATGSSVMEYSPGTLPILSKESRNIFFRSTLLWIFFSFNGQRVAEWS